MDLMTMLAAAFVLISAIGFDTVLHPRDIVLEATTAEQIGKIHVTDAMLSDVLKAQVVAIFLTPSIVAKPLIRTTGTKGIGLSISDAFGLSQVANALQEQAGYVPDQIKLYVFSENDTVKVLISGFESRHAYPFQQQVSQVKEESIVHLVERATEVGVAYIDPYMTALNLMRRHIKDGDFKRSLDVIDFAKSRLPTTGINADRSMLVNLEGMIALFNNDANRAYIIFQSAANSDPANHVALLNLALTKIALHENTSAKAQLSDMLKVDPPADRVVLATVYLTLAGADLELHELADADAAMREAADLIPSNPIVFGMWAEVKRKMGDTNAALELTEKAHSVQNEYEDYAEIAALYFTLAWRDGQPYLRSPFDMFEKTAPSAPDDANEATPASPDAAAKGSK